MYKLLCQGKHPWYVKGDSHDQAKQKLSDLDKGLLQFEFPSQYFSPLARDFFLKLCACSSAERYDADRALQHPWITRDEKQSIPMTKN
jgi:serine/threonine protein kinase